MSHPKSHVSHILILGIFVGASMAWDPWIKEAHKACLAGKLNYQVRKSWRTRCESNINQTTMPGLKNKVRLYTFSAVTNAVTKARGHIWFGNPMPNGHPSEIHFDTTLNKKDAISVTFPINGSIFIEATDYGTQYYVQIRTPDQYSAQCYKIVNMHTPNITFIWDAKCPRTK